MVYFPSGYEAISAAPVVTLQSPRGAVKRIALFARYAMMQGAKEEAMDVYTVAGAARALDVSEATIRRWCANGLLGGAYKRNKSRRLGWRIPITAISALQQPVKEG